jgi:hypothetical protein
MRVIITGHREEKLQTYELDWIKESINSILKKLNYENGISIAYSGMASGVDLFVLSLLFSVLSFAADLQSIPSISWSIAQYQLESVFHQLGRWSFDHRTFLLL